MPTCTLDMPTTADPLRILEEAVIATAVLAATSFRMKDDVVLVEILRRMVEAVDRLPNADEYIPFESEDDPEEDAE